METTQTSQEPTLKMTNNQKIQALETGKLQELMTDLSECSEAISEATVGFEWNTINEWYKAYITSPAFTELTPEQKRQSFEQYEILEEMLENLNSFMSGNDLGIFNR